MRYFKKELVSRPLYLPGGSKVGFLDVGGDTGILSTEDGFLIAELSKLAAVKKGGVLEIDQAAYEELKKNPLTSNGSSPNSSSEQGLRQQIRELQARLRRQEGVAAVNHPMSSVHVETPRIDVPTVKDMPRPATRRVADMATK